MQNRRAQDEQIVSEALLHLLGAGDEYTRCTVPMVICPNKFFDNVHFGGTTSPPQASLREG